MRAFEHLNKGHQLTRLLGLVDGGWPLETQDRDALSAVLKEQISAYKARVRKREAKKKQDAINGYNARHRKGGEA